MFSISYNYTITQRKFYEELRRTNQKNYKCISLSTTLVVSMSRDLFFIEQVEGAFFVVSKRRDALKPIALV
jgi:hypothetical protein